MDSNGSSGCRPPNGSLDAQHSPTACRQRGRHVEGERSHCRNEPFSESLKRRVLSGALLVAVARPRFLGGRRSRHGGLDRLRVLRHHRQHQRPAGLVDDRRLRRRGRGHRHASASVRRCGSRTRSRAARFGDQAFSPGLTDPAGETASKHFEASFDIATTSNDLQSRRPARRQPAYRRRSRLRSRSAPTTGSGARMSYLRFDGSRPTVCMCSSTARPLRVASWRRTSPRSTGRAPTRSGS